MAAKRQEKLKREKREAIYNSDLQKQRIITGASLLGGFLVFFVWLLVYRNTSFPF